MKILIYQSHSANNQELFNASISNHIKYCEKHNYSFYSINEPYNKYLNVETLMYLLQLNDLIISVGSDCLFTNFNKKIEEFIDSQHDIAICEEGNFTTLTNGEINFFKNTQIAKDFLLYIGTLQKQFPNETWGYQSLMNKILTEKLKFHENIQLIKAGQLQKYIPETDNILMKKYKWSSTQDFLVHTVGGTNAHKLARIKNLLQTHPEIIR